MTTTTGVASRSPSLTAREQSHRRATLLGIAALLLASTSPVFGHHLPFDADQLLAGVDHLGTLCLTALHLLLAPVHRLFHVVIVGGLVYAAWDRFRAWHRMRRTLAALEPRLPAPGDPFWRAACDAGVSPERLRIVPGLPNPVFTTGFLSPKVFIAEALAERLDAAELTAVLAHEGAHVRRRDPLRLSLLRALACTLFWIPALRRLADDMGDEAEVLADDAAATERPLVLASAILALARWPERRSSMPPALGFYRPDLLERRVRRLAGEDTPVTTHVTRRSVLGAAFALSVVWTSGLLMTHPFPSTARAEHVRHCDHRHESPFAHLFCLGSPFASAAKDCPHRSV